MAAAVRRRVAPTSLLRTLGSTSAYPNGLYRHHRAPALYGSPSSWLLRAVRCRHLVLPLHTTRAVTGFEGILL